MFGDRPILSLISLETIIGGKSKVIDQIASLLIIGDDIIDTRTLFGGRFPCGCRTFPPPDTSGGKCLDPFPCEPSLTGCPSSINVIFYFRR